MITQIIRVYPNIASVLHADDISGGILTASGVTLHHTADPDIERTVRDLRELKLGYHLIVGRDGKITQTAWLNRRVSHAGDAAWRGRSPNRHHIAVALALWGRLTKGTDGKMRAWSGVVVPDDQVAARKDAWGKPALWHAATPVQEAAVLEILGWLVSFGVTPADICGHDECALPKGRKDDPGGSMSMSMIELRAKLLAERNNKPLP